MLSELNLTTGIWILYLQHLGFSLAEIGIAEAVFHLAPITLELPSGSFADVFGRKWSLAASAFCVAASALLMLLAGSVATWLVLPAMYLGGASFAFRSGSAQAFLFDSLATRDATGTFSKLLGRLFSATYLIVAAATWLGAVLADINFAWPYALMVAIGVGAASLAASLREPERERGEHRSMRRTMIEAVLIVRAQPRLGLLLIFNSVLFTLLTLVHLYAQAVLRELGLSTSQIGLVIGGALIATAIGTWFAHRAGLWVPFRRWAILGTIVIVGSGLGLGSGVLVLAIGCYLLAELITGIYEPLAAARVNKSVSDAQRATILSIEGFMFSITMIWAFPLAGWLADRAGWLLTFGVSGAIVVAVLSLWLVATRNEPATVINRATAS